MQPFPPNRTRRPVLTALVVAVLVLTGSFTAIAGPQAALADSGPTLKLTGCNPDSSANPYITVNGDAYVCDTTQSGVSYTTGDLGKNWAEGDLVPFQVTITGTGGVTYSDLGVAVDNYIETTSTTAFDYISPLYFGSGDCTLGSQASGTTTISGAAQASLDDTYSVTMTGTGNHQQCVLNFYARLAIGSHDATPGVCESKIHAMTYDPATSQKGKDVPVKVCNGQSLSKDMSATQTQNYVWNAYWSPSTSVIPFDNSCGGPATAPYTETLNWTREPDTNPGQITVTTNIYVNNPSHVAENVTVTDVTTYNSVSQGGPQTVTQTFTATVPANTNEAVTPTPDGYVLTLPSDATNISDTATATYSNSAGPMSGTTTASASATPTFTYTNQTADITTQENLTGAGSNLQFSLDSVTGDPGTVTLNGGSYTMGSATNGTVKWDSGTLSGNGSATFNKTVYLQTAGFVGSGNLSTTVSGVASDGETFGNTNSNSVSITSDTQATINLSASIPATVATDTTVTYSIVGANPSNTYTGTFTIPAGSLSAMTTVNVEPDNYTVTLSAPGYTATPQNVNLSPVNGVVTFCSGPVALNFVLTSSPKPTCTLAATGTNAASGLSFVTIAISSKNGLNNNSIVLSELTNAALYYTSPQSKTGSTNGATAVTPGTVGSAVPLPSGDTSPYTGTVYLSAQKLAAGSSNVGFTITDANGATKSCDPVSVDPDRTTGAPTVTNVPGITQDLNNVTVYNDPSNGVQNMTITVNGVSFAFHGMKNGEQDTANIASALTAGTNTVTITTTGKPGGTAIALFGDI